MTLISWHKLDGDADDELSGHDGTWDGTEDYASGGANFAGGNSNTRIKLGGTTAPYSFSRTDPFTISCIVSWSNTDTNIRFAFASSTNISFTSPGWSIQSFSNSILFNIKQTDDSFSASASGFNDGKLHHIVGTYDGGENKNGMKLYVDGVLRTTGGNEVIDGNISSSLTPAIGAGATIGSPSVIDGEWGPGVVDECKVWDEELSATEIGLEYARSGLLFNSNNILGRYFLDGNVLDSKGTNHGTVDGTTTFSDDRASGLKSFFGDGSTHINLANESNFDFDFTNEFSISFWMKADQTGFAQDNIISKGSGLSTDEGYYVIYDHAEQKIIWRLHNGTTAYEVSADLPDEKWHYIVVTYDGSENQDGLRIYINGVDQGTPDSVATTGTMLNNEQAALLGESDGSKEFHGWLDYVEFYNIKLESTIVSGIYENLIQNKTDYSSDYDGG